MGISDVMQSGDVWAAIAEIQRQLRNLTSGRRLEDASVGARGITVRDGGAITIDGGRFYLTTPAGVQTLYLGPVAQGTIESAGWILRYDTGQVAFSLAGTPGRQAWVMYDLDGNIVLASDAASGNGLARPYLNIPMYPSSAAQHQTGGPFWPATNSTSLVELMHGFTTVWQPRIAFGMDTAASGGDTEWELRLSGDEIASGSGDANGTYDIPGWGTDVIPGDERVLQLLVRNTTGSVSWVQVDKCYGKQS